MKDQYSIITQGIWVPHSTLYVTYNIKTQVPNTVQNCDQGIQKRMEGQTKNTLESWQTKNQNIDPSS